jgi:hypothetical protein
MADPVDWCAKAAALRSRYEALRDGTANSEVRFGEDYTRKTQANLTLLLADLRDAERLCAESQGGKVRRRFAATGRMRPY